MPAKAFTDGVTPPQGSGYVVAAVTSDVNELAFVTQHIIVLVAGAIKYVDETGHTVTATFPVGTYWIRVRQIFATGTVATVLTAF